MSHRMIGTTRVTLQMEELVVQSLDKLFPTRAEGIKYITGGFMAMYVQTLKEIKGIFNRTELALLVDLCEERVPTPKILGASLITDIEMMFITGKYMKVDRGDIKAKLTALTVGQRWVLELWCSYFYKQRGYKGYAKSAYITQLVEF